MDLFQIYLALLKPSFVVFIKCTSLISKGLFNAFVNLDYTHCG